MTAQNGHLWHRPRPETEPSRVNSTTEPRRKWVEHPLQGHAGAPTGKWIKGCKQHISSGTLGLSVSPVVDPARLQDRDGAAMVMRSSRKSRPRLRLVFADRSYAGTKLPGELTVRRDWRIKIIKRSDANRGFEALPRRWVGERTEPWLGSCRRLAKDREAFVASAEGGFWSHIFRL
jgi:transposase